MKEASIRTMEPGNLMSGHSRGNYLVDRDTWEQPFADFLERSGFDGNGYKKGSGKRCFENDTFIIRPYYWEDDEEEAALPNFVYKPTGLAISWYKYPMRDAYASMNIDDETFFDIIRQCEDSMNGGQDMKEKELNSYDEAYKDMWYAAQDADAKLREAVRTVIIRSGVIDLYLPGYNQDEAIDDCKDAKRKLHLAMGDYDGQTLDLKRYYNNHKYDLMKCRDWDPERMPISRKIVELVYRETLLRI